MRCRSTFKETTEALLRRKEWKQCLNMQKCIASRKTQKKKKKEHGTPPPRECMKMYVWVCIEKAGLSPDLEIQKPASTADGTPPLSWGESPN